ncbi:Fc.00g052050.m01.CDS01 [Cosmosporella sp. VM-42]
MDSDAQPPVQTEGPELNAFGKFTAQFLQYGANASNNLQDTFTNMTTKHWIRLIMIVGGYMLLRPYLMKLGTHLGVKQMEKQEAKEKEIVKAKISANELRGLPADASDDEGESTAGDWGQKARVRQREVLKQLVEAEEKRLEDEDELKEIEDLLED